MSSRAEISEVLTEVLNERANRLAVETGFIKRVRKFDGADFAFWLVARARPVSGGPLPVLSERRT